MWTFVLAHGKCEDKVTCSVAHVKSKDIFLFFKVDLFFLYFSNTAVEHFVWTLLCQHSSGDM